MLLLVALLLLDAVLHAVVIVRFGLPGHALFLIFAVIDAALAIAVFLAAPYALWAALALPLVGVLLLTATFDIRDKIENTLIWIVDAAIVVWAAYLLVGP